MSQYYRIEVDQPATNTKSSRSWIWTPESEIVESADVDLRKDGKRISTLTVTLWDQKVNRQIWPIGNSLPDPAFADIPIRLYLSKPGESGSASKLVFDGKVTSKQGGWPAPNQLTIVGHDRSFDMRVKAAYRTIMRKTGVQLAQQIANDYGYGVDVSELVGVTLTQRMIDMGASGVGLGAFSDWNQIRRALAVDGLELYVKGKTLHIRQSAQITYPHTFQPDDGIVIDYRPTINHVRGPGTGGQSLTPLPAGNKGTKRSEQGSLNTESAAEKANNVTHRTIPQGGSDSQTGAHTESVGDNVGPSVQHRKRKDEASMTIRALPDLDLRHMIVTSGWGAQFDGTWHLASLKHSITGSGSATSTLSLESPPSKAAQQGAGVLPANFR